MFRRPQIVSVPACNARDQNGPRACCWRYNPGSSGRAARASLDPRYANQMLLRRFYDSKLAQASYLIACGRSGHAIVIDANRDADQYVRAAESEGVRIAFVTETHIHADFVSGSRELAAATGARIHLSGEGGTDWSYDFATADGAVTLRDGDVIE